jgi:hypothetical protein
MRVFQVVKSNSPAFELGYEMSAPVRLDGTEHTIGFKNFLAHLQQGATNALPLTHTPPPADVPETLPVTEIEFVDAPRVTIADLIAKAERHGFKQSDLVTAAKIYHSQPNIYRLTAAQIEDLDQRMTAKIEKLNAAQGEVAPAVAASSKTSGRNTKAMVN